MRHASAMTAPRSSARAPLLRYPCGFVVREGELFMIGAPIYAFYGYRHARLGHGEVVPTHDA